MKCRIERCRHRHLHSNTHARTLVRWDAIWVGGNRRSWKVSGWFLIASGVWCRLLGRTCLNTARSCCEKPCSDPVWDKFYSIVEMHTDDDGWRGRRRGRLMYGWRVKTERAKGGRHFLTPGSCWTDKGAQMEPSKTTGVFLRPTHTHTQHGRRSCKLHAIFTDFYFEPLQNEKNRLKDVRVREINAIALFVVVWQIIRDLTFEKHSQLGCFRL